VVSSPSTSAVKHWGAMALDDSINALENILRDLIERVLRQRYGEEWSDHLGIPAIRRAEWERRREVERKKRTAGVIDERLLYYADFPDLFTMIKQNWEPEFRACFGDQTELRVYLEKLAGLRNPDAHSRSFLKVEERLIEGMTGELRQKITIFLSKGGGGPEPERFARIEEVVDSFGNRVTGRASGGGFCRADLILRPGEHVVFRGRAWDPEGSALTWRLFFGAAGRHVELHGEAFEYEWSISEADIAQDGYVTFSLVSGRAFVRFQQYSADDTLNIFYTVLPADN
jgi:hypothetical protein